jgi:hypothetical protein
MITTKNYETKIKDGSMIEYLGFGASLLILISLLMSSIRALRLINLVGALLFGIYGIYIASTPTIFMNFGIVLINVYYLTKMHYKKSFS